MAGVAPPTVKPSGWQKAREGLASTVEAVPTLGVNQAARLGGKSLQAACNWLQGQGGAGWVGTIPRLLGKATSGVGQALSPVTQVATAPYRYAAGCGFLTPRATLCGATGPRTC